jgi:putative sterol carrier protein
MARFLSPEWFAQLDAVHVAPDPLAEADACVLEQVVTATPQGEVRYQLVVSGDAVRFEADASQEPTVTFTSDYPTAAAIARGELSTQAALLDGRLRVSGNLSGIGDALRKVSGLDLVPASMRAATTY